MKKVASERVAKCKAEGLCCGCMQPQGEGRIVRGLHANTCYSRVRALIEAGTVTEEQLIADGRLLPKASPGRKATSPITLEYAK